MGNTEIDYSTVAALILISLSSAIGCLFSILSLIKNGPSTVFIIMSVLIFMVTIISVVYTVKIYKIVYKTLNEEIKD